jgi:hypothetical protein
MISSSQFELRPLEVGPLTVLIRCMGKWSLLVLYRSMNSLEPAVHGSSGGALFNNDGQLLRKYGIGPSE